MSSVRIYGIDTSESTRAARSYFRNLDQDVTYVDLRSGAMGMMELSEFLWSFSISALVDTSSAEYKALAGDRTSVPEGELLSRIGTMPGLLRLPLVRGAGQMAVGDDESGWRRISLGISS